uniref:Uncharacterized protein n=1 Tax=Sphenodon punctatus TaxID=8508 RepID=A0A8D0HMP9_SPHPU
MLRLIRTRLTLDWWRQLWRQSLTNSSFRLLSPSYFVMSQKMGYSTQVEPESSSFVTNLFNGQISPNNVFPFPSVLSSEQAQSLQTLLDPCTRFFEEVNSPSANEKQESIEEA